MLLLDAFPRPLILPFQVSCEGLFKLLEKSFQASCESFCKHLEEDFLCFLWQLSKLIVKAYVSITSSIWKLLSSAVRKLAIAATISLNIPSTILLWHFYGIFFFENLKEFPKELPKRYFLWNSLKFSNSGLPKAFRNKIPDEISKVKQPNQFLREFTEQFPMGMPKKFPM